MIHHHKTMSNFHLYFASCIPEGGVHHYLWAGDNLQPAGFYQCDRPMYLELSSERLKVLLRQPFSTNNYSALQGYSVNYAGKLQATGCMMCTKGIVACHLCSFRGQVYIVNYLSGNIFCTSGQVDTHTGRGLNLERQASAHTHFIAPAPDGTCLLSTDLGLDAIFVYDKDLQVLDVVHVPAGHGARHLAYSQDGTTVFCVNELASTVTVFYYNNKHLVPIQTVPVLFNQSNSAAAAIRVCGNFVYVSNRGDDSISCLKWDGKRLKLLSVTPCGGRSPRDFIIVDNIAVCTNEGSDNVSFLDVCGEKLTDTGIRINIEKPVCVVAMQMDN